MNYEIRRGEIWLVNLDPTLGHEIKKSRPALIVQNDLGNRFSPMTIIAPLTSQNLERLSPVEVLVTGSGLDKDSKIIMDQIRAIDKQRLVKRLGKIDDETIVHVDDALKISLGLVRLS